jgi:hypothetical protein
MFSRFSYKSNTDDTDQMDFHGSVRTIFNYINMFGVAIQFVVLLRMENV